MKDEKMFNWGIHRRLVVAGLTFVFLLSMISCTTSSHLQKGDKEGDTFSKNIPSLSIVPAVAEYKSGVKVLIAGAGFEPGQKVKLFVTMGGVRSGIHFMVKPEPTANEFGAFASVWTPNREISKKLLEPLPTVYTLTAEDRGGAVLCTGFLGFCDPKAEKKSPICEFVK